MPQFRALVPVVALVFLSLLTGCSDDDTTDPGDPSIDSVEVSPGAATFTSIGEDIQFDAAAFDAQGAEVDTVFEWASSATDVVEVDSRGLALATGIGTAAIYATAGGVTDTAHVQVDDL